MSDMELTDVEEGNLAGASVGDLVAETLSEGSVGQITKRRRLEAPETVGVSEHAVVRVPTFPERVREIGRDLGCILQAEKEKKKISLAAHRALLDLKERYEVLFDEALRQITTLQGGIEEARGLFLAMGARERTVVAEVAPPKEVNKVAAGKAPKTKVKVTSAKVPQKAKEGRKEEPPKAKAPKGGAFVEVVSKKKKRKKKKKERKVQEIASAVTATVRPAKVIEREKARAPARAFVVSVGEAGTGEAKRKLWADLVKGVAVPKLGSSAKLPRGDLIVRPADGPTYEALKQMESEGKGVREEKARWPTVLVYDVDRDIKKEELSGQIASQNPELGLDKEAVVPLFMKGPKTDELVWWVCSVRPSAFKLLVGKSLFIGLSKCKVKEYVDVVRCFKCQHFGHRASKCGQKVDTCGRCAVKGHRAKDCKSVPVKCANCGLAAQSGHSGCSALFKATKSVARRTDFGTQ